MVIRRAIPRRARLLLFNQGLEDALVHVRNAVSVAITRRVEAFGRKSHSSKRMAKWRRLEFQEVPQAVNYPGQFDALETGIGTSTVCLAKEIRVSVLWDAVVREIENADGRRL